MNKSLCVNEGDLEIRAKTLSVAIDINKRGSCYSFPGQGVSSLLVEEREGGNITEIPLVYLCVSRLLVPPFAPQPNKNSRLYFPDYSFAQQVDDLFMRLVHGEDYAKTLPPGEQRPITLEDIQKLPEKGRMILRINEERRKRDSPYFKGELCQAVKGYLSGGQLPEGMNLLRIGPKCDKSKDIGYLLQIDLSK